MSNKFNFKSNQSSLGRNSNKEITVEDVIADDEFLRLMKAERYKHIVNKINHMYQLNLNMLNSKDILNHVYESMESIEPKKDKNEPFDFKRDYQDIILKNSEDKKSKGNLFKSNDSCSSDSNKDDN